MGVKHRPRHSRKDMKQLCVWVKPETYLLINRLAQHREPMGAVVDRMAAYCEKRLKPPETASHKC